MISFPSLKNFVYINGFLFFTGTLEYTSIGVLHLFELPFLIKGIFLLFLFFSRNYLFIQFITYQLRNKENIHPRYTKREDYKEEYPHEFTLHLLSSSAVETATYLLLKHTFFNEVSVVSYTDILSFVPYSFVFEIIFDFFHYWTHRMLHSHSFFYIHVHKKHHKFKYPMPILTFYHSPFDLLITNSMPQFISLFLFPYLSLFQFTVLLNYKSFIEISGHTSKKLYPSGSFTQCIWLPRMLHITLYAEDHTAHHSNTIGNYGKRFSLWDKWYETYLDLRGNINNQ
jgi:sterol desaturase/sphingolipid hydroxylase (fatty acid hydroxylase superfamily)